MCWRLIAEKSSQKCNLTASSYNFLRFVTFYNIMKRFLKYFLMTITVATATAFGACGNGKTAATATPTGDDTFTTPGGKTIVLNLFKHASLEICYDSLSIQVDPVVALAPETNYAAMHKADIILVTHEHFDHFDTTAINALTDSNTVLITNAAVRAKLKKGTALSNGGRLTVRDDVTVEAVPAYNTTPSHQQFHPKGRDNGYVLTLDGFRIYIAGDTEDIPEMSQLLNIDVAFLPCNQPYTMTPKQLASAALKFKPRVLYPYHYNDTPIEQVVDLLKEAKDIEVRVRNMK